MPSIPPKHFGPFRFDCDAARLWHGNQEIRLQPKPFAVLTLLVNHAGKVVAKKELWDDVWPETMGGDDVLKGCIRQIRQALGDTPNKPKYIKTVRGRGYCFIAPV